MLNLSYSLLSSYLEFTRLSSSIPFIPVAANILVTRDQFCGGWLVHGLESMVSCAVWIPCVCGWDFTHLPGPVPSMLQTSAGPQPRGWRSLSYPIQPMCSKRGIERIVTVLISVVNGKSLHVKNLCLIAIGKN